MCAYYFTDFDYIHQFVDAAFSKTLDTILKILEKKMGIENVKIICSRACKGNEAVQKKLHKAKDSNEVYKALCYKNFCNLINFNAVTKIVGLCDIPEAGDVLNDYKKYLFQKKLEDVKNYLNKRRINDGDVKNVNIYMNLNSDDLSVKGCVEFFETLDTTVDGNSVLRLLKLNFNCIQMECVISKSCSSEFFTKLEEFSIVLRNYHIRYISGEDCKVFTLNLDRVSYSVEDSQPKCT